MKKDWTLIIAIIFIILFVCGGMFIPGYYKAGFYAPEAELKSNLHQIQIGLKKYATDHEGHYPVNIEEILTVKYLSDWPYNPILKHKIRMVPISYGSEPSEGNFTYLPVYSNDLIAGYYLFAYGYKKIFDSDLDINGDGILDNVIIVISSGKDLPQLKELLK
jgi:uncharacterized protein YneF (UPF0154 family)